jgi:ribosomal protein S18 acetylase RimI-like enzyme
MDISIRELRVDDAALIAPVHVRSWQSAYEGVMDADFLDSISVAARTEMWRGLLDGANPGARLLAARGGETIGFLVGARVSPSTEGAAEVFSIYLDPSVWRGGIGTALLDAGVRALRAEGPTAIILWVADGNERACRFYESRGWYFDGGRKDEPVGGRLVPHLRYRLD